jgi:uncharacterized membrane protein YphA (DoxX/SURF4 family)
MTTSATSPTRARRASIASGVVRVGLGLLFVAAGLSKLFALGPTAMVFSDERIPFPAGVGFAVGATETLAGLLLLVGFRVRLVARLLMGVVVLAALVFHSPLGEPSGVAHARAIALTIDVFVLLGLAQLARRAP